MERGRYSGSASHIRNDGFAGQERGTDEAVRAKGEVSFGSLFVELCGFDADVCGAGSSVSQGLVATGEF